MRKYCFRQDIWRVGKICSLYKRKTSTSYKQVQAQQLSIINTGSVLRGANKKCFFYCLTACEQLSYSTYIFKSLT